jgi:hypothetical protein
MHRYHGTRRVFLAALLMMVALVHAGSDSASATAHKRPDFGSAEGFRLECELLGGTYSEDGIGNTNCHYPDGTWTQCDANGNDCWITPPARPPATTLDPDDVTIGEATTDHGETSATAPETVGPTVVAADDEEKPAKTKAKRAKGKKRKK